MTTIKLIITSTIVSSAVLLQACGVGEASNSTAEEIQAAMPVPVEIAYPVREDLYATYHVTTTIASDIDAPVLARVQGEVVKLLVEEGDRVIQGQALARLDGERLRLDMLAAKATHT